MVQYNLLVPHKKQMLEQSQNSKRLAKNTGLLYIRMLFLMVISLYTSRINLNALGVVDYGIYNVVGGVVAMFAVISGSLSATISRFITFELGTGDKAKLKRIFSTSLTIQFFLSFIIVIICEVVGVWFLNNKMQIPPDRLTAANWVLQFSLMTFVLNLISVPYDAAIVAHERMSAFAYISILDGIGKLAIAFTVLHAHTDKLILYALMIVLMAYLIRVVYVVYCKRKFEECTYHFVYDKELLNKIFGFASWNFIGSIAVILRDQGGTIIINLFCGPVVNAARGIANQVNTAISKFVSSFQTALNPQITKSYASGNYDYMMTLIFQGARLSYYILLFMSLPVICNTHYILQVWLGQVPEHSVLFIQLVLLFSMNESLANTLITAMLATGNIRNFQIIVGGLNLLNLPLAYLCLRLGCIPESVMIVAIVVSVICEMARVLLLRKMIHLSARKFITNVYLNVIFVTIVAGALPYWLGLQLEESFYVFMLICFVSVVCTLMSILYVGCNEKERSFVYSKIFAMMKKYKKNDKHHI